MKPKPTLIGYLRSHPKSGNLEKQKKVVEDWYWRFGKVDYQWGSWCHDRGPIIDISERKQLNLVWKDLKKGDMILFSWFGVMFHTLDDAVVGIPRFLCKGIRLYSVGDRLEITDDTLHLLKIMRREWYVVSPSRGQSKAATALLGSKIMKRKGEREKSHPELAFMRHFYHERITKGKTLEVVFNENKGMIHPRTGNPVCLGQIKHVVESYHSVLASIQLGRTMPNWINRAIKAGYFTETIADLVANRQIVLDRLRKIGRRKLNLKPKANHEN